MQENQATESLARSSWCGDVLINGKLSYTFSVDSVTGELFTIARERTLDKKVSVAFDTALAKRQAHARRKYDEALKAVPEAISNQYSVTAQGPDGYYALGFVCRNPGRCRRTCWDRRLLGGVYLTFTLFSFITSS
ncbi:hypothetical protein [Paenibacillus sp. CECT 9249]|uniref:hypothetical protein n=1 Tax=Paenibacillus sp. CECT 9249 TaxID=2845385 RepID=UPI001E4D6134|nr:hypothetical protein [Paenibacillus sp. CECT 9249]